MDTEVQVAEAPAPEQVATAAPEPVVETPVAEQQEQKPAKTFTQEELDAAISKRLAREQRKWEREQAARSKAPPAPTEVPKVEQFESPEAYAEVLAAQKAEQLIAQREAEKRRHEALDAYHEREEDARSKYADFEQVAYNPSTRITEVMAETIQASEVGPEVAYYLGSNPKEADRISRLSPFLQAKEIGRIEAKLIAEPPAKKTTTAPPPIAPVTGKGMSTAPTFDTTDPRSIQSMTTSQWIEAERQRQIKRLQAQQPR